MANGSYSYSDSEALADNTSATSGGKGDVAVAIGTGSDATATGGSADTAFAYGHLRRRKRNRAAATTGPLLTASPPWPRPATAVTTGPLRRRHACQAGLGSNDAASAIGGHEVVGVIGSGLTPPNGLIVERPGAIDIVTPFHPAT